MMKNWFPRFKLLNILPLQKFHGISNFLQSKSKTFHVEDPEQGGTTPNDIETTTFLNIYSLLLEQK